MVKVVKAPEEYKQGDACDIFLGGSIDMGSAENWQEKFINDFSEYENVVILNPRRDDWDSSWTQDPTPGTQFHEQVEWELDQQENADIIVYYFAPNSKSPITLLELGLFGADNVIVCCPKEFYRYGNVKMICDRYNITIVESYEDMINIIKKSLEEENIS